MDDSTDLCQLCSPNCYRCDIAYNNCIACKSGWVLFKQLDTTTVTNDYCVPGDGVSHFHVADVTDTTTDKSWGLSGSQYDYTYHATATSAHYFNPCLHGLTERSQYISATTADNTFLWNNVETDDAD